MRRRRQQYLPPPHVGVVHLLDVPCRQQHARNGIHQAASHASIGSSSDVSQNDDITIGGNQLLSLSPSILSLSASPPPLTGGCNATEGAGYALSPAQSWESGVPYGTIGSWHLAKERSWRHPQKSAKNCNLTDVPRRAWL